MAGPTQRIVAGSGWTKILAARGRAALAELDVYGNVFLAVADGKLPADGVLGHPFNGRWRRPVRGKEIIWARGAGVEVFATLLSINPDLAFAKEGEDWGGGGDGGGLSFEFASVVTAADVEAYESDIDGVPLRLTSANHIVFGPAPYGTLTLGTDYTVTATGGLLLDFTVPADLLLNIVRMPWVSNGAAQALVQSYRDELLAAGGQAVTDAQSAASLAAGAAGTAVTQAGVATGAAATASGAAGTATTQAGVATTQAGIATTQAGLAGDAAATQVALAVAPIQSVISPIGDGYSVTDAWGTAAWGTVDPETGRWPTWALAELAALLPLPDFSAFEAMIQPSATGLTVQDAWGTAAWGTLDPETGQWPQWAMDELAARIGGGGAGAAGANYHLKHDKYWPTDTDMTKIVQLGDSTMRGMQDNFPAMMAGMTTADGQAITDIVNIAQNGERAAQNAARFGTPGMFAKLTMTDNQIAASGVSTGTSSNLTANGQRLRPYTGWLAGVHGTLASTGSVYQFTRTTAGDVVAVPPDSEFVPELGPQYHDAFLLLHVGKNDFTTNEGEGGTSGATAAYVNNIVWQIVDTLGPLNSRFLVLGDFMNNASASDHYYREQLELGNAQKAARFGPLYLDVTAYICSPQVWIDAVEWDPSFPGPTSTDLAQQALGNKSDSLSEDNGHFNALGSDLVLNYLVKPRMIELGWYKEADA